MTLDSELSPLAKAVLKDAGLDESSVWGHAAAGAASNLARRGVRPISAKQQRQREEAGKSSGDKRRGKGKGKSATYSNGPIPVRDVAGEWDRRDEEGDEKGKADPGSGTHKDRKVFDKDLKRTGKKADKYADANYRAHPNYEKGEKARREHAQAKDLHAQYGSKDGDEKGGIVARAKKVVSDAKAGAKAGKSEKRSEIESALERLDKQIADLDGDPAPGKPDNEGPVKKAKRWGKDVKAGAKVGELKARRKALRVALADLQEAYNPNQRRDRTGKWSSMFGSKNLFGPQAPKAKDRDGHMVAPPPGKADSGSKGNRPLWRYQDARGVERHGHMESFSDRGGTDVTYNFRDRDTNELSLVSGSRLKAARRVGTSSVPKEPKKGTPEFEASRKRLAQKNKERYGKAAAHGDPGFERQDQLARFEDDGGATPGKLDPGPTIEDKPIHDLASEISKDWRKQKGGVNFAAKPYLDAMGALKDIGDKYGADDARGILAYFMSNAGQWRGEKAREIKTEIRRRLKTR